MPYSDPLQPVGGWCAPEVVRLPPPPPGERGLIFLSLSLVSRWFGRPELPHIFPVLNINRRLFRGWLFFASRLMPFGKLPATVREKLILRVAWNCRSRYEWGQHVDIALSVGVRDEEIVALARNDNAGFDDHDRLLMRACDQQCQNKLICAEDWQALAAHYTQAELIEMVMLVGHYEMVAGLLINAGIELEDSIESRLQEFYQRIA